MAKDVDEYLSEVEEPKRSTLEALRRTILELVPDAVETISYAVPGYKVEGKAIAGFAAFKHHLAYLPHSGSVFDKLGADLDGYERTKGSLHFAIDEPLPRDVVAALIRTRAAEAGVTVACG
jgi:uncharacterized protein YdhG (YjbR/CyaY superfamily)